MLPQHKPPSNIYSAQRAIIDLHKTIFHILNRKTHSIQSLWAWFQVLRQMGRKLVANALIFKLLAFVKACKSGKHRGKEQGPFVKTFNFQRHRVRNMPCRHGTCLHTARWAPTAPCLATFLLPTSYILLGYTAQNRPCSPSHLTRVIRSILFYGNMQKKRQMIHEDSQPTDWCYLHSRLGYSCLTGRICLDLWKQLWASAVPAPAKLLREAPEV